MPARARLPRFVGFLLAVFVLVATAAPAEEQEQQPGAPNIPEMEAALAQTWAMALAMDDSTEPMWRMQAFGTIAMQEFMLDRARAMARGVPDDQLPNADASRDRMIAHWRREKPGDPGPDLFLTFAIEDMAERLPPTLALLARYPDDVLVVSTANALLRNLDQTARAGEILEAFLQRNPENPQAYKMLVNHYGSLQEETRKTELIVRWAQREPVDPEAVSSWLSSSLAEQEPAATVALLERFFAGQPRGSAALSACTEIARRRADYRQAARACIARVAGGGDGSPAAKAAAEQAGAELASIAARDGDWKGLLDSLGKLPREQRRRALLAAVQQVPAPEGCATRVELLRVAGEAPGTDPDEQASLATSIAGALHLCAAHGPARVMYLDLLRTAPNPDAVVSSWVARMRDPIRGDRWLGDLPAAEAAPILERRLRENPAPEVATALYRALDVTYQVARDFAAHAKLLARWRQQQPDDLDAEQTIALAGYLLMEDKPDEAIALLQARAKVDSGRRVQETLWQIYQVTGHPERAERMARDLLAGDEWRAAVGELLAGRAALLARDLGKAERGYTAYLRRSPDTEVAAELVAAAAQLQGSAAGTAMATRLCASAKLAEGGGEPASCAAALVAKSGDNAAATKLLAQQAIQHPDDIVTLRDLAWKAQSAQQWEIAEQTRRRIVALDPKSSVEWVNLGIVLEKRGKTAELERLVAEARGAFQHPPVDLLRAAGRAWTAAGDARRAVPLLEEARAAMPAGSELAWIDAELRQAYAAAGRWESPYAVAADDARLAALGRAAEGGDLAAMYEFGGESLRKGRSREQCERGIAMLERAAGAGHKKSAAYLGNVLYYGSAPCREAAPAAALPWLRRAVDDKTRRPDPLFDLGLMLLLGDGVAAAPAEGMALIERAAAFPDLLAVETAGLAYASGLGVPRDLAKAHTYFSEADRLGSDSLDKLAQNTEWRPLSDLARRAIDRLETLAASGDPAASGLLARLHQLGRLVPYDVDRAVTLARDAAARGDATAMRVLFYAYLDGRGVARDGDESLRWLRRGAEAGNSYCMMFLSQRLMKGEGVPRDLTQGLTWLERAATAGNYWALGSMARVYAEGWHGLPRDPEKALPWMKKLAEQGDFEARGWLALHGQPVKEMKEIEE
ncbi:MAG TPA: hypothetical protein VN811_03985 [Thermoanaerobaculia bacterium]|nr:hypothetical protein [Thermoanaerobaculia bacterium]